MDGEGCALALTLAGLAFLLGLWVWDLGRSNGDARTEAEICTAICGEHWTREPEGPCVCLEVVDG